MAITWWPVALFVAWSLLVPTLAGRPPNGSGVARTVDWLALPFAALVWERATPTASRVIALGAAAALLVSCALAGLQHFGAWPAEAAFEGLRWTQLPFARVYELVPGATDRFMGGGLHFHRLKFAHVSALGVLAAACLAPRSRLALGVAAAGFLSVWLFPYARAAAVAMTVAVGVALVRGAARPKRAALLAGGVALLALALVLLTPTLRDRFASSFTAGGSGERVELLETGWRAVKEHPFAGIGPGQFRPAKFADPETPTLVTDNAGKAHQQLLSIAAETGVPGLLCFLGMLGTLGWRGRRSPLMLGALCFFALLSLAHDPLFQAPFSMTLVLVLGLASSRAAADAARGSGPASPTSQE
jgi:O-antigen ligase